MPKELGNLHALTALHLFGNKLSDEFCIVHYSLQTCLNEYHVSRTFAPPTRGLLTQNVLWNLILQNSAVSLLSLSQTPCKEVKVAGIVPVATAHEHKNIPRNSTKRISAMNPANAVGGTHCCSRSRKPRNECTY